MSINDIIRSAVNNVQKNEFNVDEWAKEKNKQREWAYQTQDEMAEKITIDSEKFKSYLNVQSQFPNYSVGNALLVTVQKPNAKQLRDADSWKRDKVYFKNSLMGEYNAKDDSIHYDVDNYACKREVEVTPNGERIIYTCNFIEEG